VTAPRQLVAAVLAAGLLAVPGGDVARAVERLAVTFDHAPVGEAPPEFVFAGNRQPNPGRWQVSSTGARRYLVHFADPSVTMRGIAVGTIQAPTPADIRVTAQLRMLDGDFAGGVVWRYRDADNFYFLSLVLSDHSLSVFKVIDGTRVRLAAVTGIEVDPEEWHTLAAIHQDDQIRGVINGVTILRTRDSAINGGRAGIWSAGNSTTWFDDVVIETLE
jgi:hypothetical protein